MSHCVIKVRCSLQSSGILMENNANVLILYYYSACCAGGGPWTAAVFSAAGLLHGLWGQ